MRASTQKARGRKPGSGRKKGATYDKALPPGTELNDLARGLEHWRNLRGLGKNELAAQAGLPATSVIRASRATKGLHTSSIEAIAGALDISVSALFARVPDDMLEWVRRHPDVVRRVLHLAKRDAGALQRLIGTPVHDAGPASPPQRRVRGRSRQRP